MEDEYIRPFISYRLELKPRDAFAMACRRLKKATGWASRYAAVAEGWAALLAQVEGMG